MTFPMYEKDPIGIYSEQEKQQLTVIIKSGTLEQVKEYLQENAIMDEWGINAFNYVLTKKNESLDVIVLNGKIDVNYANTTTVDKYYYQLRIASFKLNIK